MLFLVLLNIPSIVLETNSINISSPISYLVFFLLAVLIFNNKTKLPKEILFLAFTSSLYFLISAFKSGDLLLLFVTYAKFLLYLFGLFISLRYINQNTIILLLFAGATTILLDSLFFRFNDFQGIDYISEYGRYAGFYLNPNTASVICLIGFILTIVKKDKWRLLSIPFSFLGFLTLSRTFLLIWFIINFIHLFYNRKYIIRTLLILVTAFFLLVTFSEKLNLDTIRFQFLTGIFSGKLDEKVLTYDSRQDQWSKFYNAIIDEPIIGNGFKTFSSSNDTGEQGVHNTFLLIFGESGFLPFLLFLALIIRLLHDTFRSIRYDLNPFFLMILLIGILLVNHNFFDSGITIFIFTFLIHKNNQESYIKTI